jgi:hypothetical protein
MRLCGDKKVKVNHGGAVVDEQTFEGFEEDLSRTVEIYFINQSISFHLPIS